MIDTIRLIRPAPLPPSSALIERGFRPLRGRMSSNSKSATWVWNAVRENGVFPRLTWSSTLWGDWITAETSMPKMLYGNNVQLVDDADVHRGLDVISQFVYEEAGTLFDAHTALVSRVDYCGNFLVGEENVIAYLVAAAGASPPRLTRYQIGDTTVTFKNKSQVIRLYDKHCEVANLVRDGTAGNDELLAALGILRLEVSHLHSGACKRLAKRLALPDRRASHLLVGSVAFEELARNLAALGLDRLMEPVDMRLDILRETYGDNPHCRRLAGFLGFLDRYSENFWRQCIGGYSRSLYYSHARDLKKAGVWLKTEHQLPPLYLIRTVQGVRAGNGSL